ncbi:MAG TPA: DUF4270 family protein [Saprospiraceae bacterium]|nr:DUF4270 domain-containing protein [Saprospiraceae bacterium]HPG05974.1 DUF4270 family protein [Saprospiraceae bacterium]HPR01738.1 DUF4270 family protein [Saprospiraceae bacterium]HQU51439.1 DUF4270 family protein [Saprospiraceae bacterium]HRV83502.1 DUF4270 family protein [Saprospiraceae bacterium]
MKTHRFWLGSALLLLVMCNDPSPLGSDFLKDVELDIGFTDTFSINAFTIHEDSIETYSPSSLTPIRTYLVGTLNDPIFGRSESNIYTQLDYDVFSPPSLSDAVLDSVVLTLAFDSLGIYGDTTQPLQIQVDRLIENMNIAESTYSNHGFLGKKVGELTNYIYSADSITIIEPNSSGDLDTIQTAPQLRIRLNNSIGEELIELDTSGVLDADNIYDHLYGLGIKTVASNQAMLGIDLNSEYSTLTLYYEKNSNKYKYSFLMSSAVKRTLEFSTDHTGAPVESFLDDSTKGDSLDFLQPLGGTNIQLSVPALANLSNYIINKAELECYVATVDGDNLDFYPPANQVAPYEEYENELIPATDVFIGNDVRFLLSTSGGTVEEVSTGLYRYRANISSHLQDMINGTIENKVFLVPYPRRESPRRTIVYGPHHPTYPMKLRITYTLK